MVRRLESLHTIPMVRLNRTGIVTPSPAMVIGHVVGPIKPPKLATAIGPTILSTIQPLVFLTIVTSVEPTILSAIFLPHISDLRHPWIISPPPAMMAAGPRSAVERPWAAIRRTSLLAVAAMPIVVSIIAPQRTIPEMPVFKDRPLPLRCQPRTQGRVDYLAPRSGLSRLHHRRLSCSTRSHPYHYRYPNHLCCAGHNLLLGTDVAASSYLAEKRAYNVCPPADASCIAPVGFGPSGKRSAAHEMRDGHHCQTPRVTIRVRPAGIQAARLTETSRLTTRVLSPHRPR
jgi:hypothetical protein